MVLLQPGLEPLGIDGGNQGGVIDVKIDRSFGSRFPLKTIVQAGPVAPLVSRIEREPAPPIVQRFMEQGQACRPLLLTVVVGNQRKRNMLVFADDGQAICSIARSGAHLCRQCSAAATDAGNRDVVVEGNESGVMKGAPVDGYGPGIEQMNLFIAVRIPCDCEIEGRQIRIVAD